jgi:hypothetical protein
MSKLRFLALFLLAGACFAQHGRAFSAAPGGFGQRASGFGQTGLPLGIASAPTSNAGFFGYRPDYGRGFGFRRGYAGDFLFPFAPVWDDYLPPAGYFSPDEGPGFPQCPAAFVQPPQPPPPVHPVVHEYTWTDSNSADESTFTIALKSGVKLAAVTLWVEDNKLHYIDEYDNRSVVSSDLIDHEETRRLNREKNLRIQLPPA